MVKKRVVLTFPAEITEKPLTYQLVKDYDLVINILQAKVMPNEPGKLLVEISNNAAQKIKDGIDFLTANGVNVQPLNKEIVVAKEECISCGTCTAVCRFGALTIQKPDWKLNFDKNLCTACQMCVKACPMKAIKVSF